MDIKKALEVLELCPDASLEEIKQAHRDLVSVWHPDRFSHSPRLRKKAEDKTKEANLAYETAVRGFRSGFKRGAGQKEKSKGKYTGAHRSAGNTEAAFEMGTCFLLTTCYRVYRKVRNMVDEGGNMPEDSSPRH